MNNNIYIFSIFLKIRYNYIFLKKMTTKNIIITVIVIIFIILIILFFSIIGIYYYFNNRPNENSNENTHQVPTKRDNSGEIDYPSEYSDSKDYNKEFDPYEE